MTVNYALWWFLKPSHLLCLLVIVGGLLLWRGRRRAGRWLLGLGLGGLLIGGFLPVSSWLIGPLENRFPQPALPAQIDGIIVLAGSEQPAQTAVRHFPQLNDYGDRLTTGLALAHLYPQAMLVHSGRLPVHEDDIGQETTASDVAREFLLSGGVDPARLVLEARSTNTCESARELVGQIAPEPGAVWLLVTSAVHMPRSVACFRAAGWDPLPVPVDYRQSAGSWSPLSTNLPANLARLNLAAHEWLGLIYYRVRGITDELFPAPL